MPVDTKDRNEEEIYEGDRVWTRYRGEIHEGVVDKIVVTDEEARKEGVRLPPKVGLSQCHHQARGLWLLT